MGMPMAQIEREQVGPLLAGVVSIILAKASQSERHYDPAGLAMICGAPDIKRIKT
jgi:hypothetical protein